MEDECIFLSIEDVRELELKQVRVFLGDKGGLVEGGWLLAFFQDCRQMFRLQKVDGESSELRHLESTFSYVKSSGNVPFKN